MQQNAFVQSMKTIAQSAITKAGFDKTRNGQIVGVNTVTNTYSIKVDGIIYNNVKVVNGMEYNKGDIVKVNIPMNNPSQAYISSSVLSDDSIGSKIATTQRLIDEVNKKADSIIVVMGRVYQLSIDIAYEPYVDPSDAKQYWRNVYTAVLTQDGVDVTDQYSSGEFDWYLEKPNGNTVIPGSPSKTIQLNTKDYLYGQSVMLEWRHTYIDEETQQQKEMVLRSRVTLFDNGSISNVAKYTTEINSGGVFVHRADGNYDVGADWQSTWAYGVKIADTVDIIKAGQIWGSFGGSYLTIGRTSGNNFNIYASTNSSSGSLQFRYNSDVLTEIKNSTITLGRTGSSYYNAYMDTSSFMMRKGTSQVLMKLTGTTLEFYRNGYVAMQLSSNGMDLYTATSSNKSLATFNTSGMTLRNSSGYTTFSASANSMNLYSGQSSNINIASFSASGVTLRNSSGYSTFYAGNSGIVLYNGTSSNIQLASFNSSGVTLRNPSGYVTFTAGANSMNLYTGTATNVALASFTTSGLTLRNSSGTECMYVTSSSLRVGDIGFWSRNTGGLLGMYIAGTGGYGDDMNLYVSGHTGYLEASNGTLHLGSGGSEIMLSINTDALRPTGDNETNLGISSSRWKKVYAASSTISTSDKKDKDILGNINFAHDLIMSLCPIRYMWKKGDHNRTWMGFIAQDIAKWCNDRNLNLGLYTASYKDEDEDGGHHDGYHGEEVDDNLLNWGLAYEELIAPLIQVVQDQEKTINDLERRLSQLEQKE